MRGVQNVNIKHKNHLAIYATTLKIILPLFDMCIKMHY